MWRIPTHSTFLETYSNPHFSVYPEPTLPCARISTFNFQQWSTTKNKGGHVSTRSMAQIIPMAMIPTSLSLSVFLLQHGETDESGACGHSPDAKQGKSGKGHWKMLEARGYGSKLRFKRLCSSGPTMEVQQAFALGDIASTPFLLICFSYAQPNESTRKLIILQYLGNIP